MIASRFSVSSLLSFFSRSPRLDLRSSKVGASGGGFAASGGGILLRSPSIRSDCGGAFRTSRARSGLASPTSARIASALLVLLMSRLLVVPEPVVVELVDGVLERLRIADGSHLLEFLGGARLLIKKIVEAVHVRGDALGNGVEGVDLEEEERHLLRDLADRIATGDHPVPYQDFDLHGILLETHVVQEELALRLEVGDQHHELVLQGGVQRVELGHMGRQLLVPLAGLLIAVGVALLQPETVVEA